MDPVVLRIHGDNQDGIINQNAIYKYDNDDSVVDNEDALLLVQFQGSNTSFKTKMVKSISVPKVYYIAVNSFNLQIFPKQF